MCGLFARFSLLVLLGVLAAPFESRVEARDIPTQPLGLSGQKAGLDVSHAVSVPELDLATIATRDEQRAAEGLAPRFAVPNNVSIAPGANGTWTDAGEGVRVWRTRITSPGALSINLGFARYKMPVGGALFVYAADGSDVRGPFTSADNEDHGELWTPVVLSDDVMVEVSLPAGAEEELELELTAINSGYRFFGDDSADKSGSCNIDVVCPEGDDWRDEIQTVGVISTGGYTFCTGFMVNNTSGDETPYFLTAFHCEIDEFNASSLVVYWNYQSPTCGQQGGGSLDDSQTGSYFRSASADSDFTLLELDDDPDSSWNVAFAGWNRSNADPTSAVGIHHPSTDEKSISFENDACTTTSYLSTSTTNGDGTHIRVIDWDLGTTEGGSSGSPLFDQDHYVVGQLHGGHAACGNNESDWYGRFSVSWNGGGTSDSRLSDWLDPGNTGMTSVETLVPGAQRTRITLTTGLPELVSPGESMDVAVEVVSVGETTVAGSPTLHYRYDGGAFSTVAMTHLGGTSYEATLPAVSCGQMPECYVSAEGSISGTVTLPADAPSNLFHTMVGEYSFVMLDDDFETDMGWSITAGADTGNWERADPIQVQTGYPDYTITQPEDDHSETGTLCYVTQAAAGDQAGSYDVDGGPSHLISPVFDLSNSDAIIGYWRWYHISTTYDDSMVVAVSNDNGGTWTTVETVSDRQTWTYVEWKVSDFVTPTSQVRVRFTVDDSGTGSLIEALVDDVTVLSLQCVDPGTCSDGLLNQDEDRIDCGGVCDACECVSDSECEDLLFCTGTESCNDHGQCGSSGNPCSGSTWCDDFEDVCVQYGDGDFDVDSDVDLVDFAAFQLCFGSSATTDCRPGNMTGDAIIDVQDYTEFTTALTGP